MSLVPLKKWNLTKGSLTINGAPIVGFQDGDIIAAEPTNDQHTLHMSCDNVDRMSENPNKNGTIAIGLSGNSPALTAVQAMIDSGLPLVINYKDFTADGAFVLGTNCAIQKNAAFTRALEIADIVFPFLVGQLSYKHASPAIGV